MTLRIDHKVPGGKLIRVRIEADEGRGRAIALEVGVAGDFFAHPEEAFEAAEASLAGLALEELPAAALAAFARPGLVLFGAAPADIAAALERCRAALLETRRAAALEEGRAAELSRGAAPPIGAAAPPSDGAEPPSGAAVQDGADAH